MDLEKLLTTLRNLEFCISQGDHCSVCPSCHRCRHKHLDEAGHVKGCELATAIGDVENELEARKPR